MKKRAPTGPDRRPWWRRPAYRAVWKAQRALGSRVCIDVGGDHRSSMYVVGSSRSGTTWIAEFLNYRNEYRYLFEPLTEGVLPELRAFRRGQYLRPDDAAAAYLDPFAAVLRGDVHNRFVDRFNRRVVARRRLVKDVYANLLLRWVHDNFPGMPIVYVLRHPCAVMTSRLANSVRSDAGYAPHLQRFLEQDALMADWLHPFEATLRDARTVLDQQVLWWCVENFVPLRQFAAGELHVALYEDLVTKPHDEIPRLGAYLGREFHPSVYQRMRRVSLTSGRFSPMHREGSAVASWQRSWSDDEVRRVMQLLSVFGLDALYTDEPMPRPHAIAELMSRGPVRPDPARASRVTAAAP